jgi:hypothetical protein
VLAGWLDKDANLDFFIGGNPYRETEFFVWIYLGLDLLTKNPGLGYIDFLDSVRENRDVPGGEV